MGAACAWPQGHALANSWERSFNNSHALVLFPVNSVWFPYNWSVTSLSFNGKPPSTVGAANRGCRSNPLRRKAVPEAVLNSYVVRSLRFWSSSRYCAAILCHREWYGPSWEDVGEDSRRRMSICVCINCWTSCLIEEDGAVAIKTPHPKSPRVPCCQSVTQPRQPQSCRGHDTRLTVVGNRSFRVLQSNKKWRSRNSHSARNLQ
jgi:hypothetical protein